MIPKTKFNYLVFIVTVCILLAIVGVMWQNSTVAPKDFIEVDRLAAISPDYSGIIIPPNIAPLNFYIKESGECYYVKIYSKNSKPIKIYSKTGGIRIPLKPWKKLLSTNKGNEFYFEVFLKRQNQWERYAPIINTIAKEEIDSFMVFRQLRPQYYQKAEMKIIQRNIENYDQKLIIDQRSLNGCFNCHSFFQKKPQKFIIQARHNGRNYMVLSDNGKVSLIEPKFRRLGSAYLSWHPSGDMIALTMDTKYAEFNFIAGTIPEEKLEFFDIDGDIAIYNLKTNTVATTLDIACADKIEVQPEWSCDGTYLYYIRAPKMPIEEYAKMKYDLMRISYDIKTDTWGKPEVIIASKDSGLSIAFPKFSPDGKYLLFCASDRSSLTVLRSSTDLYLMNVETGKYKKLEINSDRVDSYHSWSLNSRWFVFASKRDDGVFTKPYFCHIDEEGNVSKPFVIPQEDPYFYDTFNRCFNVPELISESIRLNTFSFAKEITAIDKIIKTKLDKDLSSGLNESSSSGGEYGGYGKSGSGYVQ